MWWSDAPNWDWYHHWQGWPEKINAIASLAHPRPIWITETGLATRSAEDNAVGRHHDQMLRLRESAVAPVPRVYWYTLIDLDPAREAIEGFHIDENEYHLGLVTHSGEPKPAFHALEEMLRADKL